ncbi:hypothetical protein ACEPAF_2917 [Sanghuangporus sanghuang]
MDVNRVLVTGESAGGYLAMQLALEHFKPASEPKIRTVVPLYPMIDIRSPHWTTDYEKSIFGVPQLPNSFIDEFIASASKSPETDRNEWSHCPRYSTRHKAVKGLKEERDDDEALRLVVHRGEHGFDNVLHIDDEDWLKESVTFIERHWLG